MPIPRPPVKRASVAEAAQTAGQLATSISAIPFMNGAEFLNVKPDASGIYRVRHGLGRPYKGFICYQGYDVVDIQSNANRSTEILLQAGTTGGTQELISRYTFASDSTSATMFTGLDGDTDSWWSYRFEIVHVASALTTNYTLNPNGSTANGWGAQFWVTGLPGTGNANHATEVLLARPLCTTGSAYSHIVGHGECHVKTTGRARTFLTRYHEADGATNALHNNGIADGVWKNTTDNITSLGITSDRALQIGTGSWFELYRNSTATVATRPLDFWVF